MACLSPFSVWNKQSGSVQQISTELVKSSEFTTVSNCKFLFDAVGSGCGRNNKVEPTPFFYFFISLRRFSSAPGCWQLRVTSKKFSTQIKNRRRQKMFEKKVCSKLCRPLSFSRRHLFRTFEQIWAFRCFYLIGAKWTAAVIVPPKHWFRNIIFFGFRCFRETGTGKVDSLPNMSIKKFCLIRSRCPRNEPEGGLLLFALQSTMIAAKVSRALKMSQKSVMTTKRWKWFRSKSLIVLRSLEKQQFRPLCWWMKSNRCLFLNYPQIMSSKHSCYHQIDRVRKKCSRCAQNRWPVSCQLLEWFSSISDPLWGLGVASTRVVSAL